MLQSTNTRNCADAGCRDHCREQHRLKRGDGDIFGRIYGHLYIKLYIDVYIYKELFMPEKLFSLYIRACYMFCFICVSISLRGRVSPVPAIPSISHGVPILVRSICRLHATFRLVRENSNFYVRM